MNNSSLTNQDRSVILDFMQKKRPMAVSGNKKDAKSNAEVLQLINQGAKILSSNATEDNPVQFAKKGATFKSNCNCPSKLAKQGGKLVIVDCHGQILR